MDSDKYTNVPGTKPGNQKLCSLVNTFKEEKEVMKKKVMLLPLLVAMLSIQNCDALCDAAGVCLLDEGDFKADKPGNGWVFLTGLEFTRDEIPDNLTKADGADLSVPGLGTVLKEAASKGGVSTDRAIVAAKEVTYKGAKKWQLAFTLKVDGDSIVYKVQKGFPVASGAGKYGLWLSANSIAFVTGAAQNCDGNGVPGIWAISGVNNFLTKTNSTGRYALPIESGDDGSSVALTLEDQDCGGSANVSAPAPAPGDTTGNPKDGGDGAPTNMDSDEPPTECAGDESNEPTVVAEARDSGPMREEPPEVPAPDYGIENDCGGWIVGTMYSDYTGEEKPAADWTDASSIKCSAKNTAAPFDNGVLLISTGTSDGRHALGSAAGVPVDTAEVSSIIVTYTVLSQEFPVYATGAYNDAIGFGFVGSTSPIAMDTVGQIQSDVFFDWAYTPTNAKYNNVTYGVNADFEDMSTFIDLTGSVDKTTMHKSGNSFGGVSSGPNDKRNTTRSVTVEVPRELKGQLVTFAIAVGDVGDSYFDTAVAIHGIELVP